MTATTPSSSTRPSPPINQRTFSSSSGNIPITPQSRRQSTTAKLVSSPLKKSDSFLKQNDKTKMSVINSMLHQSPSSNSVFSLNSGSGATPPAPSLSALGGNTHIIPNRSGTPSDLDNLDIPNFGVDTSDFDLINEVHKHLVAENTGLHLPGGDMSRDLYKYTNNTNAIDASTNSSASSVRSGGHRIRRSSSFSFSERRGSSASGLNVPGGFRREFIVKRKREEFKKINKDPGEVELPPFLARNFMEFLSIYGHFAGESLEDDDYQTCTLSSSKILDEENAPLLGDRGRSDDYRSIAQPSTTVTRTATPVKAFFLLLKSFVGTGVLFLPKAFYNGGLLFSVFTLMFFAIYSFWCYYILVRTKDATRVSSFGEMGTLLYGKTMKFLIIFSIVLSQLGFVAAYLVFTSTNLQAFLVNLFNIKLEILHLIIAQCFIFVPLSLVRNITKLSLSSLIANFFIFIGLAVIVYYTLADLAANGPAPIANFNSSSWSLFIGVAIFAFEGIGLIIPIQESMIEPHKFPKVLFAVIVTVTVLMLVIGSLCYWTYGDATNTVIILNLPQDSILVNSVQLFYSVAILLSAPLQLFPVIKIVENKVFGRSCGGKKSLRIKWCKNAMRSSIVITCCIIAYYGSANLDKFVSFIGCFACIPLVYMYPPMLHYKAVSKTRLSRAFDVFLVIFGGFAMIYVMMQLFDGN
ncbi:Avt4 protein [Saccharomycopsis crataegensis]|uniref:Avt4 protein n=1 Tax=Saccharomycopsis crataegensis TaxID=43959 RepID=A0AAV5QWB5_9ASCO|nr:Avt4 protein [Saccharomycopsis crataegensis]